MIALAQLRALVGLRWQMVRSARTRRGLIVLLAGVPLAVAVAVVGGRLGPHQLATDVVLLAPTALAGFAVLALLAPLSAGGGNELFPADQLVALPVRPATTFFASLLLAPLNVAWLSQLLILMALTSAATSSATGLPLALLTTCLYVVLVTVAGQTLAWVVVGTRQTRAGRVTVWLIAAGLILTAVAVVRLGYTTRVLDNLPTRRVFGSILRAGNHDYLAWAVSVLPMLLLTAVAGLLGARACGWALRRPTRGVRRDRRTVNRRSEPRTALRGLLAVDRASVWRSPPLRRGAVILIVLPAAAAAGFEISWTSLVLLPGLVAAGTGLLFGVNAFCLDGSGALWLASMPHRPALAAVSKTIVLVETCLLAVASVLVAGALRAKGDPSIADVTAILSASVACTLWVAATGMKLSTTRPHRADLGGARDTPAPPGSMAIYSARLAVSTTLIGVVISIGAYARFWQLPVVFALPVCLLALRSLVRSVGRYENPTLRAIVVHTVAAG